MKNIASKLTQRVPKRDVCLRGIDLYMKMGFFFHVDIIKILIANLEFKPILYKYFVVCTL